MLFLIIYWTLRNYWGTTAPVGTICRDGCNCKQGPCLSKELMKASPVLSGDTRAIRCGAGCWVILKCNIDRRVWFGSGKSAVVKKILLSLALLMKFESLPGCRHIAGKRKNNATAFGMQTSTIWRVMGGLGNYQMEKQLQFQGGRNRNYWEAFSAECMIMFWKIIVITGLRYVMILENVQRAHAWWWHSINLNWLCSSPVRVSSVMKSFLPLILTDDFPSVTCVEILFIYCVIIIEGIVW